MRRNRCAHLGIIIVLMASLLSGCVPSSPYPGGYVVKTGSAWTLRVVPCWQKSTGFSSAQIATVTDDGDLRVVWRIERSNGPGIKEVQLGSVPDGFRSVVSSFDGSFDARLQYDVGFDDQTGAGLAFSGSSLAEQDFKSPVVGVADESELLAMSDRKFGC